MGQKINPHGFRVGVIKDWDSRWIAKKDQIADYIVEDDKIRKYIKTKHIAAGISKIEIERAANKIVVIIYTARPGILIGKAGAGIDELRNELAKEIGKNVAINIIEIRRPDVDAQLIAENVAGQLERRISFRRAMKQCISRAMKSGVKGVKIKCGGRLGGAEIARSEEYHEGSIPLQTIRADIDYGFAEAATTYGRIGIKVWVYRGEVLGNPLKDRKRPEQQQADNKPQQRRRRRQPEGGRKNADA